MKSCLQRCLKIPLLYIGCFLFVGCGEDKAGAINAIDLARAQNIYALKVKIPVGSVKFGESFYLQRETSEGDVSWAGGFDPYTYHDEKFTGELTLFYFDNTRELVVQDGMGQSRHALRSEGLTFSSPLQYGSADWRKYIMCFGNSSEALDLALGKSYTSSDAEVQGRLDNAEWVRFTLVEYDAFVTGKGVKQSSPR